MYSARLIVQLLCIAIFASFIGGCGAQGNYGFLPAPGFMPSDEPLEEAKIQFSHGNYGLAEKQYKIAVEKNPQSTEAWVGLAASYDHLRRFDLADKAYAVVKKLHGETPSILNNIGYSYILRGDLQKARSILLQAYNGDPENPYIVNNIDLLNSRLAAQGQEIVSLGKS